MDFGSILEGSGRVLGGFSEGLECFWMDFGRLWERFWTCLALFGHAGAYSLNWTPALIREASQFACQTFGNAIRVSPNPARQDSNEC